MEDFLKGGKDLKKLGLIAVGFILLLILLKTVLKSIVFLVKFGPILLIIFLIGYFLKLVFKDGKSVKEAWQVYVDYFKNIISFVKKKINSK